MHFLRALFGRQWPFVPLWFSVFGVWCLTSCKDVGKPEGTFRPAQGGRVYGGVFRVNETAEMRGLDPIGINDVTSAHIASNVYDNLMTFDAQLNLVPELAKSFEVSPDGLTYTYHLITNAVFHDDPCFPNGVGRRMTARDVLYSFTRVCDARALTRAFDYFRGKVDGADEFYEATQRAMSGKPLTIRSVRGFSVVDDSTFRIRLTKPFGPFEFMVALNSMGIHPREAVEHYGNDFTQHPVGTGPFRFVRWEPDRELVLTRNEKYWMKDEFGNSMPYLDGVRFTFLKDDKLQLLEFTAGNLEESYRIANEFFGDIVDEQKKPKGKYARYQLLHIPAMATQFYGMLLTDPVFRNVHVRRAFNYAVDRERIIRYVLKGQAAAPAHHGIVPPSVTGYATDSIRGYRFDLARARAEMAKAGYPDGKGFPKITLQLNAGGGRNVQIAEAVQSMLQEHLGITIDFKQVEFAQHLEYIDHGRSPFFRLGWIADYPDPETFLNLFYGKLVPADPETASPTNMTRFRNARYDALFETALRETDRTKRFALYREAEQIAIDEAPMLWLHYDEDYRFVQPYVMGYQNNSMDRRVYRTVWFDHTKIPKK
jgi:peptide/nickel transport system substrate-binding protein